MEIIYKAIEPNKTREVANSKILKEEGKKW